MTSHRRPRSTRSRSAGRAFPNPPPASTCPPASSDTVEATALIAALPREHRALWACGMYAGLRRGELMALRWCDVDLAVGVIHVRRGWDAVAGPIAAKSTKGRRRVPIAAVLRDHLVDHRVDASGDDDELVFVRTATVPFHPGAVTRAADRAWKAAAHDRVTLHECRHSFASLMIAAGVNAKALSTFMGHANICDHVGPLRPPHARQRGRGRAPAGPLPRRGRGQGAGGGAWCVAPRWNGARSGAYPPRRRRFPCK
jgi:integrase